MSVRILVTGIAAGLTGVAAVLTAAAPAGAEPVLTEQARSEIRSYQIPGEGVFPEGVAVDRRTGHFYVGSTADGTIFRGHVGEEAMEVFLPGGGDGRTTAIGLHVDPAGRLYVSGGGTGQMWVYDTATGDLVRRFDTGLREGTFINDVTLDRSGNAYFTDSMHPVLWRVPAGALDGSGGVAEPQRFLDFTGTPAEYGPGFNLNGIETAPDGTHLLAVASNTGKLFRIGLADRGVAEVPVDGEPLTAGDGIEMVGADLFVVRNQFETITTVRLAGGTGRVVDAYMDESLRFPTTADFARGRLLVVNAQFDRRESGDPVLPFTVSSVPISDVTG